MNRSLSLGILVVANLPWLGLAEEPKSPGNPKPQYERMLQGEDAKQAAGLLKKRAALEAAGKRDEALKVAEEILALRKKVQGDDHWETIEARLAVEDLRKPRTPDQVRQLAEANRLNMQVFALYQQGKYQEAIPLAEQALQIRENILGKKHPEYAQSLFNLAAQYNNRGHLDKAESLYREALTILREVLGANHPFTATSLNDLAGLYKSQGKYTEAEPLFREALTIRREVLLGAKHSSTAISLNGLAGLYESQGKYTEAEPLFREALTIRRQILGDKHPITAQSLNNLAALYEFQGKYAEAEPLFREALTIHHEVLGAKHPSTATSLNGLAGLYESQGKYTEAEPLFREALTIRRQILGDKHPITAQSLNNLAVLYESQRKYAEAEPLYQEALRIIRQARGNRHPDTATSLNNLAGLYESQRKYAEAEPLYREALTIHHEVLGANHPFTATNLKNLARLYQSQGRYAEAEKVLLECRRSFEASRIQRGRALERSLENIKTDPNPFLAAVSARLGKPIDAFRAIELDRGRGLLDEQAARRGAGLSPEEQNRQQQITARLSAIEPRQLKLASQAQRSAPEQTELDGFISERRQLEDALADFSAALSQREVADLKAIQAALPADAAFITWIDVAYQSSNWQEHWACVVRSSGEPRWERLPGSGDQGQWTSEDTNLTDQLRAAILADKDSSEIARKLHTQRIAPIEKHLVGVKTLHVAAVGWMAGIPIEVLARNYTISYTPSATHLVRQKARARSTGSTLLALGDPIFDPEGRKPTPAELPPGGLLILQVAPGGAADAVRLQANDALVSYAGIELTSVEQLTQLMQQHAQAKTIEIKVWREGQRAIATREIPPGKLGVVFAKEPAPKVLADRRKFDEALVKASRGKEWQDLPGTRVELVQLRQLFGDRATLLADESASEQKLEALRASGELKKFRYLHFATHGEGDSVKAFRSALILTQQGLSKEPLPGQKFYDGKLTAEEVLNTWELDADLVTLSACETALGKESGGDGLLGFAQAFLSAGARSVCLSLWKVDDAATALLMDRFYRNLMEMKMAKGAALAEAKAWLRDLSSEEALQRTATLTNGVVRGKGQVIRPLLPAVPMEKGAKPYAHPRFWSAFILIGEAE